MRLIHDDRSNQDSPFSAAWSEFRSRLSGPVGCLLAILCLPFALIALVVMVCVAMWRVRRVRKAIGDQVASAKATGEALPVAEFVRSFAIDPTFTREEAEGAAVPATAGRSAAQLLADAIERGWVRERDGLLAVTDRGREESEAILRSRGM